MQSENIAELAKALAAAQVVLQNPTKKKTAKVGTYSYSYADIAEVLDTVRPVLAKHGIAINQLTDVRDEVMFVDTFLSHAGSGQQMWSTYPVCRLGGDHQKMGAALTYARRYALCAMVGVAAEDDTDAQGAAETPNGHKTMRGPLWGASRQAKARGDWGELENDLRDCHSVVAVDKLQRDYQATQYPTWSVAWREQAEELFEKRREDFGQAPGEALTLREQLQGSVATLASEAETVREPATRADYLRYCSSTIDVLSSTDEINQWWDEQTPARKRFRLSPSEEEGIKVLAKERLKAIRKPAPTTTFVPNARERAEAESEKT